MIVSQGKVASAGAKIEYGHGAGRWHQTCRLPAPVLVHVETEQVVEEIVARRNGSEHSAYAGLPFIQQ